MAAAMAWMACLSSCSCACALPELACAACICHAWLQSAHEASPHVRLGTWLGGSTITTAVVWADATPAAPKALASHIAIQTSHSTVQSSPRAIQRCSGWVQAAPQLMRQAQVAAAVLAWWLSALFDDGPRSCLTFLTQASPEQSCMRLLTPAMQKHIRLHSSG